MEDSEIQMVESRVDSAVDGVNDSRSPRFFASTPFRRLSRGRVSLLVP